MKQEEALKILKMGHNVFLTGEPGSGKTHTINEYVAYLHSQGIEVAITASTGIAATHISGITIHSWAGIGIKSALEKADLRKISQTKYIVKRVKPAKVLIIDEVSMLSPETFSMVDQVCREIKQSTLPFGGMQVVLVGDFFQLPPVVKSEIIDENGQVSLLVKESFGRFAYGSSAWARAKVMVCYLTEQHRQDDGEFLNLLSAIRSNKFTDAHRAFLASRKINGQELPVNVPKLFSHNVNVDTVNNQILSTLDTQEKVFTMTSEGFEVLVEILKKGCLSPQVLQLKVGAAVMFTKNSLKGAFVNGTLGVVEGFEKDSTYPIIKTREGRTIIADPVDWTIEEGGKVRAKISQLPLRLAWAITVHKSQGMSLDEAVIDLSRVFEYGQGYVALSRLRRLSGLYLLGLNERAFLVHPEVLQKDAEFRQQSYDAVITLADISAPDLKKLHDKFIAICKTHSGVLEKYATVMPDMQSDEVMDAVRQSIAAAKEPNGFTEIRKEHKRAYLPWDGEQDEKLQSLFIRGTSMKELALEFNRTRGAIKARLVKLGYLGGGKVL